MTPRVDYGEACSDVQQNPISWKSSCHSQMLPVVVTGEVGISAIQLNQWIITDLIQRIYPGEFSLCSSDTDYSTHAFPCWTKYGEGALSFLVGREWTKTVWDGSSALSTFGHLSSPGCGDNCNRLFVGTNFVPIHQVLHSSAKCLPCTWYVGGGLKHCSHKESETPAQGAKTKQSSPKLLNVLWKWKYLECVCECSWSGF